MFTGGGGLAAAATARLQLTIDESTAVAVAQPEPEFSRIGFRATGIAVFVLWNLTTLIGAPAGNLAGDPRTYGLDAASATAFPGLLWPRLRTMRPGAVAVAAAALAAALIPIAPAGVPVLAAVLVALAAR